MNQTSQYIPRFRRHFLYPNYWPTWLAIAGFASIAYLPAKWRDPILGQLGRWAAKLAKGPVQRADINLRYCFPQYTAAQRQAVIQQMFTTAPQAIVLMIEMALRGAKRVSSKIVWHQAEILQQVKQQNVIFLVPHGWAVDLPAMLLAATGQPMAAMFHNQRNELFDYFWNCLRRRFGGRLHARNDGIKPFIQSVRQGYWGYYLPDQDHGPENCEFVDFFATYKATLPAIGRLMKVCRARVIPLFPVYDGKKHQLDIYLRPMMDDLADADLPTIARRMNEEVEQFVAPHPEQYTWILKLLKTRKPGEPEPYAQPINTDD